MQQCTNNALDELTKPVSEKHAVDFVFERNLGAFFNAKTVAAGLVPGQSIQLDINGGIERVVGKKR